ncbi:alpha/beta fold hydrolase [Skermania sp. ID1734]|uniref:alpha/beta fold hydrolase n=1 Tax=Skermania sp. ID1734 TaxID=2597516 RepID=UPI00118074FB|nr:alpha/beta fold hydrolase [Skermania sp. ID1734]TSD97245.1 alpha/beta fold hydrolase [Skermania sp. ID1734]
MSSVFDPSRTLEQRRQAVANLFDFVVKGNVGDKTRTPSDVIDDGPQRTLHRYTFTGTPQGAPVLLVPPLGAQATCFDLHSGCSVAQHLLSQQRRTYLVDYGEIGVGERSLGLEHWIDGVVPTAVRKVSEDNDGADVDLVGWCLGGLLALLTVAADPSLPVRSVAMVASPFDNSENPLADPVRKVGAVTGGRVFDSTVRALGGVPAKLVEQGFKAMSLPVYLKKSVTLFKHRDDREFLAHIEAVDDLMNSMLAYPGRATLQVYHQLFQRNALASGTFKTGERTIDLAEVRVPVMNVAGTTDTLVPKGVAHRVGELVPNAPNVRLETAPGGHLGVLTGRSAETTTWAYLDDFLSSN